MEQLCRLPQFRVALNSRCGHRCYFCRLSGEALPTAPGVELAPNDLMKVAASVRKHGISSVKLTGGDPALYGPLVTAAEMLKRRMGFTYVEVITRHPSVRKLALGLAKAGVDQLNISLDTLDRAKHKKICGIDDLPDLLLAIESCVSAGLRVKINTVVMRGVNDYEVYDLIHRCAELGVATIKLLDVIEDLDAGKESFSSRLHVTQPGSLQEIYTPLDSIAEHLGSIAVNETIRTQGDLGHPMTAFKLASGVEVIVKDSRAGAWYGAICAGCPHYPCHDALMALRLTADLRLQFCLLGSNNVIDLAEAVRAGDEGRIDYLVETALKVYSSASFTTDAKRHSALVHIG